MSNYKNGPEGMPRVPHMPDAVLDCLIRDSLFKYLANAYEGENLDRLYGLMHDVAEEALARVSLPAAPAPTEQAELPPLPTSFQQLVRLDGSMCDAFTQNQMCAYAREAIARIVGADHEGSRLITRLMTEVGDLRAALAARQAPDGRDARDAALDVLAERRRQIESEGWTPEGDDEYEGGELSIAAACYSLAGDAPHGRSPNDWPWDENWWKPADDRRNLVKAAALILADIERIDRATLAQETPHAKG